MGTSRASSTGQISIRRIADRTIISKTWMLITCPQIWRNPICSPNIPKNVQIQIHTSKEQANQHTRVLPRLPLIQIKMVTTVIQIITCIITNRSKSILMRRSIAIKKGQLRKLRICNKYRMIMSNEHRVIINTT